MRQNPLLCMAHTFYREFMRVTQTASFHMSPNKVKMLTALAFNIQQSLVRLHIILSKITQKLLSYYISKFVSYIL